MNNTFEQELAFKYKIIIKFFSTTMPNPKIELEYSSQFQLLVAVILSAQCTDKRVNFVSKNLFKDFPSAYEMSSASEEEIFQLIKSISYPKSKAKYLKQTASILVESFEGEVPRSIEELQKLPGVGRKTANVVSFNLFGTETLGVDTHVFRVSKRIGLVNKNLTTSIAVEKQICQYLARRYWGIINHWFVLHGRYVCKAKNPKCQECELKIICNYYNAN